MYQLSVPVMNSTVTRETRAEFLRQFRACEVKRVFLVPDTDVQTGEVRDFDALRENLAYFEDQGIEGAIWVGETVGHGGLSHDTVSKKREGTMTPMVNFAGEVRPGTRCPLDPVFQKNVSAIFQSLARSGAKLILIDDDFRISQHGKEHFCCLCSLHIDRICSILGERVSREELRERIFCGKPNPYRNAYLKASGDSLRELARLLRHAVDEVDSSVGLALCSCHSVWDSDGVDPIELTEILRGEHAPVLRLLGAPYWAVRTNKKMPAVFEIARMMASFCRGRDYELMSECDAYPRPRYHVPASFLELQDALIQADQGYTTTLKYMFDYCAPPTYETGYVERHIRDLPNLKRLRALFAEGEQIGVGVPIRPHLLQDADCDLCDVSMQSPYPVAGVLMGYCTLPTTYSGRMLTRAVFGTNTQDLSDADLDDGVILDAVSAILLRERGVDVGLPKDVDLRAAFERTRVPFLIPVDRKGRITTMNNECKLLNVQPVEMAIPMLYGQTEEGERLLCYRYENARGQRFLVYLFDGMSLHPDSGLLQGYLSQAVVTEGVEWVARRALPAKCEGHPQLYMMCRESEKALIVGLFNCHADSICVPKVRLSEEYGSLECLNTEGVLKGNCVELGELGAYAWAAFRVEK